MPPKKTGRTEGKGKTKGKAKSRARVQIEPTPTPESPRRRAFDGLNRVLLQRECNKRGVEPGSTNEATREALRQFDSKEQQLSDTAAAENVPQTGEAAGAGGLSPPRHSFGGMTRPLLRLECQKRGIAFAVSNEKTRKNLEKYDQRKEQGRPSPPSSRQADRPRSSDVNYDSLSMKQLREECKNRGLKANPTKKVTIERLQEYDRKYGSGSQRAKSRSATPRRVRISPPRTRQSPASKVSGPVTRSRSKSSGSPSGVSIQPPQSEKEAEGRSQVTVGSSEQEQFPELRMRQDQVNGQGNCIFHAFALTFYDDVTRWSEVRQHTRQFFRRATDPQHTNTPESRSRRELYGDLNVVDLSERDQERGLRRWVEGGNHRATFSHGDNLHNQLRRSMAWAEHAMLQVLADAFDVEIFAFVFMGGSFSLQAVRGRFGARQIFLVNYPTRYGLGHWNPLRLLNDSPVTAHIRFDILNGGRIRAPLVTGATSDYYMLHAPPLERSTPAPVGAGPRNIAVPFHLTGHLGMPVPAEEQVAEDDGNDGNDDDDDDDDDGDDHHHDDNDNDKTDSSSKESEDLLSDYKSDGATDHRRHDRNQTPNKGSSSSSSSKSLKRAASEVTTEIGSPAKRSRTEPHVHPYVEASQSPRSILRRSSSVRQRHLQRDLSQLPGSTLRRSATEPPHGAAEYEHAQQGAGSSRGFPLTFINSWRRMRNLFRPEPENPEPPGMHLPLIRTTGRGFDEGPAPELLTARAAEALRLANLAAALARDDSASRPGQSSFHWPSPRRRQPNRAAEYFEIYEDPDARPTPETISISLPRNSDSDSHPQQPFIRTASAVPNASQDNLWWDRAQGDPPLTWWRNGRTAPVGESPPWTRYTASLLSRGPSWNVSAPELRVASQEPRHNVAPQSDEGRDEDQT